MDVKVASQDDEDDAQITATNPTSSSDSDKGPMASLGGHPMSPDGPSVSGHHDPRRRCIYLAILAFSILNALAGLVLLLVWMLNYRKVTGFGLTDKGQLANLHPILMYTFMVSINMYSVLIYRTHYDAPKARLKWTHAGLSGLNMLMSLLGVAAMYKAHLMGNLANFYSLHSWIGAITNGFYLSQFLFGLVAFLRPGLSLQQRANLMPWHRLVGAMTLVLAATAATTGIAELVIFQDVDGSYGKFTAITFIANFAGLCVVLMTASSIYLLTASQYLRPSLPGELAMPKR